MKKTNAKLTPLACSDIKRNQQINVTPAGASAEHAVIFGDERADTIAGGLANDHLYGGGALRSSRICSSNDLIWRAAA